MKSQKCIISGLSGSGKSTAIKIFEDLGFYCVDNLPATLIPKFIELFQMSEQDFSGVVMGVDIRERDFLKEFPPIFTRLKQKMPVELIFFEASKKVLLRRFSETRRRHPLAMDSKLSAGIDMEVKAMEPIRKLSDRIIDTSEINVHDLKKMLTSIFRAREENQGIIISFISFGYKYGIPFEADIVLDVRFLPNPYFMENLRPHTGRHRKVRKFIFSTPEAGRFLEKLEDLLTYLIPLYINEGKSYLLIGLGCTGGRHRSVAIVEEMKSRLENCGYKVETTHRDISKEK